MSIEALTSAEISLPARPDAGLVRSRIAILAKHVDLVGLTDNHAGQPRMSPLAAVALAREQGVATVVHVSCRDRNRLALRSQIVGAAALGCVADPFAADLEAELALLGRKVAAGADFVQTQMVFDPAGLASFLDRAREGGKLGGCRVYASVAVLRSRRMADYVNQALPGFSLPAAAYQQIAAGGGVDLATELAVTLAGVDGVDALHVMPLDEEAAGRVAAAFRAGRGAPVERVPRGRPQAP